MGFTKNISLRVRVGVLGRSQGKWAKKKKGKGATHRRRQEPEKKKSIFHQNHANPFTTDKCSLQAREWGSGNKVKRGLSIEKRTSGLQYSRSKKWFLRTSPKDGGRETVEAGGARV